MQFAPSRTINFMWYVERAGREFDPTKKISPHSNAQEVRVPLNLIRIFSRPNCDNPSMKFESASFPGAARKVGHCRTRDFFAGRCYLR